MTNYVAQQKQGWMENFNTVVALYFILKSNEALLRIKNPNTVMSDGFVSVGAMEFIDFTYDVEIKSKRALGQPFYDLFLRAVHNENTEILPEYMRESLGRIFGEYRLTPDGIYGNLYHYVKNMQDRKRLKAKREDTQNDTGAGIADSDFRGNGTDNDRAGFSC